MVEMDTKWDIDTKPIESVQVAISLFGEKNDQRRNRSPNKDELEKEEDLDSILKDVANMKVKLGAKDFAHMQTLLQLEHYKKTADEFSTLLKSSELEKDIYINECKVAKMSISELESRIKDMTDQLSEFSIVREQLSLILSELWVTEGEVHRPEKDQTEEVETSLSMTEELSRHVFELNETIMHLKLAAVEAQKEKDAMISATELERQLAEEAAKEAEEQQQSSTKRLEMIHSLDKQILDKSVYIESLRKELRKANELHSSSKKVAFDAISELDQLKADLELKERKSSDQGSFINLLGTELKELKQELSIADHEMNSLTINVQEMKEELENRKREIIEARKKETQAEVEIALLKSELHQGRSIIAAAAAAEERAKGEKAALYVALQQLELEAEEAKKENQQLKASRTTAEESESFFTPHLQTEDLTQSREDLSGDSKMNYDEGENHKSDEEVRLSKEEYEVLITKAKEAEELKSGYEQRIESENLKRELEIATLKVTDFRTRAEQAISRAEAAENAKAALEEQIKKWEEQIKKWKELKTKKKAESVASQEESMSKEITSFRYNNAPPKIYQPLGKILDMTF